MSTKKAINNYFSQENIKFMKLNNKTTHDLTKQQVVIKETVKT